MRLTRVRFLMQQYFAKTCIVILIDIREEEDFIPDTEAETFL